MKRKIFQMLRNIYIQMKLDKLFPISLRAKFERPYYGYIVQQGAALGKALGHKKISVIEFGVAGGNGLLVLEYFARSIGKKLGIEIEVYGFDTGAGLPKIENDYRDLPFIWQRGDFKMNFDALSKKLKKAKLVIGDIKDTGLSFFETYKPAPIAAISFDMDLYSSTAAALKIFEGKDEYLLPRVFSYFDDIFVNEEGLISDWTGKRLAIKEFNEKDEMKKISPMYYLIQNPHITRAYNMIYIFHKFNHKDYNKYIGGEKNYRYINAE
jgi:hypothetical protein